MFRNYRSRHRGSGVTGLVEEVIRSDVGVATNTKYEQYISLSRLGQGSHGRHTTHIHVYSINLKTCIQLGKVVSNYMVINVQPLARLPPQGALPALGGNYSYFYFQIFFN